jgi:hypothetical protein
MNLLANGLPGTTLFWLFFPIIVMFLFTLIHCLRHWNRPQ